MFKELLNLAMLTVLLAMTFATSALAVGIMPNLANVPTGWTTDRYDPASFTNVGPYNGRLNALGIAINSTTDLANRPPAYQSTFYNTQGRQFAFSPLAGPGSVISADLFVESSWSNGSLGSVRSDVWGVLYDNTNTISAYAILGFTNYGGAPRFRVWDGAAWVDLGATVNFNAWNRFSIELMPDTSLRYFINGSLVYTDAATNSSVAYSAVIMQAYNFADPPAAPGAVLAPYTAHWANSTLVVDDDSQASETDCDATDSAFTTIQSAANAAAAGGEIKVCPGTYNESPTVDKDLVIQSTGGRDVTNIQLLPNLSPGTGYLAGVYINSATADVVINGFTITGNDAVGMGLANSNIVVQSAASVALNNSRLRVGARGPGTNGDDAIGLVTTYASGAGAVSMTNNEILPVNTSASRAFYVNPATGTTFNFQNNQVSGNFLSNSATECGGSISNNTFAGTGTSGGFGAYNFGGPACGNPGPFTNNSVTGATTGILIYGANGVVLTGNSFTNNVTGIAIEPVDVTGTVVNFNRIANNSVSGIRNNTASIVNAENNWWGCNTGPSGAATGGCSAVPNGVTGSGTAGVDANPWLVLTTSAATPSVVVGGSDVVTSSITTNSNSTTPGGGFIWNGTPATFVGSFGTVTPPANVTASGVTTTTFIGTAQGVGGVATTVDGQTVSAQIIVYNAACAAVSMPTSTTLTGASIVVPVNTDEMAGRGAISADFTITYLPSVLTTVGPNFGVSLGTVGNSNGGGRTLTVSQAVPGTLVISVFGTNEFQGSGPLVNLNFSVNGLPATSSPLIFSSFTYNELDNPCSVKTNGLVSVISGNISGVVTYGNALGSPAPPRYVPNVLVSADGAVIDTSDLTDAGGYYELSGMGSGSYLVTPTKSGGVTNLTISSLDSACIAQHVVGNPLSGICNGSPGLNPTQLAVADVSGAAGVTSFDAALIARWAAGLPSFGSTSTWYFSPVNRTYPTVYVNYPNEDYTAFLMGDVTGNYNPASPRPAPFPQGERPMRIAAPELSVAAGSQVAIPVSVQDTTGKSILGYQFVMTYDPTVLEPSASTADLAGTISEGMSATVNSTERGRLTVVVFGANELAGAGDLLKLKFNVIGDVDSASDLSWEIFAINEGGINFETQNGRVVVSAASNDADINGRILSAFGQPVSGATITITDTTGQTRITRSSSLGQFTFADLTVGQTYTVNVSAKRFTFTPRIVNVGNEAVYIDMIAEQ